MSTLIPRFLIVVCLISGHRLFAQHQFQLTQYQEVMPLYNPAFCAIENYTDVRFGVRKQWVGFDHSPFTSYAAVSGVLPGLKKRRRGVRYKSPYDIEKLTDMVETPANGLRMSNPALYRRIIRDSVRLAVRKLDAQARLKLRRQLKTSSRLAHQPKHGYSTALASDQQGAFSTFSLNLGYAIHLPVSNKVMMAAGFSGLLTNTRFDNTRAQVLDETNDQLYQRYLAGAVGSNALFVNTGLLLYSSDFYLGYSIVKVASAGLSSELAFGEAMIDTQHNLSAGLHINAGADFSISPGVLFTYKHQAPSVLNLSTRVYYQERLWLGANLRNRDAAGASFGVIFSDMYRLSYAVDIPVSALSRTNGGTHELVFGIMLSRGASPNPIIR